MITPRIPRNELIEIVTDAAHAAEFPAEAADRVLEHVATVNHVVFGLFTSHTISGDDMIQCHCPLSGAGIVTYLEYEPWDGDPDTRVESELPEAMWSKFVHTFDDEMSQRTGNRYFVVEVED